MDDRFCHDQIIQDGDETDQLHGSKIIFFITIRPKMQNLHLTSLHFRFLVTLQVPHLRSDCYHKNISYCHFIGQFHHHLLKLSPLERIVLSPLNNDKQKSS